MTNTFSSTRWTRFVARRPLLLSTTLAAGTVLILSGHIAQAQPLLAGQKPYRDRADREKSATEEDGYTERSSTRTRTTHSTTYPAVQPMPTAESMAQAMSQPMRSHRVMMVLPLRTGENWKAAPDFTRSFLRQMDVALRRALTNTGRFTTLEVRRFNPVLMRAVQDGVATSDELDTLLTQPTTPNASVFLSKIAFNKAPLHTFTEPAVIASFVLENMTMTDNAVSVKMTGRMYSADGQTALRSLSATTTVPLAMAGADVLASTSTAGTTAIDRIITEFLRNPTKSEIVLGEAAPTATTTTTTTTTVETTQTETPGATLPGNPIAGSSTRAPGTPATNNNGTGQPVAPATATVGITTVTEIPPAETFPAATSTDATAATGTDATAAPGVDESTSTTTTDTTVTDTTVTDPAVSGDAGSTSDAFPDMSSGTTSSGGATTEPTTSGGTTSDEATASGQPLPTPTDNAATEGTTSDGSTSEGTVGAMSTESHGKRSPSPSTIGNNDEELGFEY